MIAGIYWDIESMFFRYQQLVRKHILNKGYEIGPRYISTSEKNSYRFTGIRHKRGFSHVEGTNEKNGADLALLNRINEDIKNDSIDVIVIISNDKIFHKIKTDRSIIVFHDLKSMTTKYKIELIHIFNNFKD